MSVIIVNLYNKVFGWVFSYFHEEGANVMKPVKDFFAERWGIVAVLAVINLFFSIASPYYFQIYTLTNLFDHAAFTLILATGMVFVIATGGIDLSIGSIMAFTGIVIALLFNNKVPPVLAILIGLSIGALIGLVNGTIIAKLNLQPFIVTLAMLSIIRGLALVFSGGYAIVGLPKAFTSIFAGQGVVRNGVYISLAVLTLGWILANKTRFGLYVKSIGGNEKCAYLCGVNTERIKIIVYCLQGFLATLATLTFMASVDAAEPTAGLSTEWMEAIAAPIIGGNSMTGGSASVVGTIIGALILSSIRTGLNIFQVQPSYQQLAIGLVTIGAVIIDSLKVKHKVGK